MAEQIPFSAVGRLNLPSLKNTVSLPNTIDAERIVVDMTALHRLQRLGGFSSTHLISTQTPEENGKGSIFDPHTDTPILRASHGMTTNGVSIHMDTVANIAASSDTADQHSNIHQPPEVRFAQELSRTCSHAFRQAAFSHLLKRSHPDLFGAIEKGELVDSKLLMAFGASILGPATADTLSLPPTLPAALCAGLMYASLAVPAAKQYRRETNHKKSLFYEKRWSIIPALKQPDRYLGLAAMSLVTPIIKSRQ